MDAKDVLNITETKPEEQSDKASVHRVSPTALMKANFLQWNIIDSIANAVLGWFIICIFLFWADPNAQMWSITGVTFIFVGLVAYADIFGVFLYLTNKIIMEIQVKTRPPFPDLKELKKLCRIAALVWFVIMFALSKLSYDMVYETIRSFIHY